MAGFPEEAFPEAPGTLRGGDTLGVDLVTIGTCVVDGGRMTGRSTPGTSRNSSGVTMARLFVAVGSAAVRLLFALSWASRSRAWARWPRTAARSSWARCPANNRSSSVLGGLPPGGMGPAEFEG
ncbi:hypothetical protein CVV68_10445 [Arthrobacter livingstonensis]|uniref:Uncharacterized protein n=1 Tax=Arthrobacter livingstonensis TaxID=670078 RepID=A0A2V5L7M4_9MICC|nr:hypothetical protein CVV68_10445 [Arthrobacter livingstonensis]